MAFLKIIIVFYIIAITLTQVNKRPPPTKKKKPNPEWREKRRWVERDPNPDFFFTRWLMFYSRATSGEPAVEENDFLSPFFCFFFPFRRP